MGNIILLSLYRILPRRNKATYPRVHESRNQIPLRILLMPFSLCYNDKQGVIICVTVAHVSLVFRY